MKLYIWLIVLVLFSGAVYAAAPVLSSVVGGAKEKEPFDSSLVGYWDFDKWDRHYVNDSTTNNNDCLIVNDTNRTYGKLGYGMKFDGIDDYVNCGRDASLDFGTGDFTIEAWIKFDTLHKGRIVAKLGSAGFVFQVWDESPYLYFYTTNGDAYDVRYGSDILSDNQWHHIVGVRESDELYLYADGAGPLSVTHSGTKGSIDITDSATDLVIGKHSTYPFNGSIDEVRIYNRALSAREVAKHYSQGIGKGNITTQTPLAVAPNRTNMTDQDGDVIYTAVDWYKDGVINATTGHPDDNWTVLFMPMDRRNLTGTVDDYSVAQNDGAITGARFTNDSAMGLGAMSFNGSQYVDVGNDVSLDFGTGDFSLEGWFKGAGSWVNRYIVIKKHYGQTGYYVSGDSNQIRFGVEDTDGDRMWIYSGTPLLNDGVWHHFVAVRIGTETVNLYIDGVSRGTMSSDGNPVGDTSAGASYPLRIGKRSDGEEYFNGTIDEVRIYNKSLSASEIRQHYKAGMLKGLILNHSETKKNEKWNATVTLYDNSTTASTAINFSFGEIVSCGYLESEGDWEIDAEDGCVLDDNYDLGGNNVTISGGGNFRFDGYNITGYGTIVMRGTSATDRLTVTCNKGGCFKN